jgi:hypothetical protein
MSGWRDRYWLIERGRIGPEVGEALAEDFVCCEVPVGEDSARALEVFTSREGAEAEARGIESLARTKHLHMARVHGEWARGEAYGAASGEVVELSGPELFDVLDSSSVPYVLLDPPPVDRPVTERLHIESAPAFAKELRRRLIGAVSEGWT